MQPLNFLIKQNVFQNLLIGLWIKLMLENHKKYLLSCLYKNNILSLSLCATYLKFWAKNEESSFFWKKGHRYNLSRSINFIFSTIILMSNGFKKIILSPFKITYTYPFKGTYLFACNPAGHKVHLGLVVHFLSSLCP